MRICPHKQRVFSQTINDVLIRVLFCMALALHMLAIFTANCSSHPWKNWTIWLLLYRWLGIISKASPYHFPWLFVFDTKYDKSSHVSDTLSSPTIWSNLLEKFYLFRAQRHLPPAGSLSKLTNELVQPVYKDKMESYLTSISMILRCLSVVANSMFLSESEFVEYNL